MNAMTTIKGTIVAVVFGVLMAPIAPAVVGDSACNSVSKSGSTAAYSYTGGTTT